MLTKPCIHMNGAHLAWPQPHEKLQQLLAQRQAEAPAHLHKSQWPRRFRDRLDRKPRRTRKLLQHIICKSCSRAILPRCLIVLRIDAAHLCPRHRRKIKSSVFTNHAIHRPHARNMVTPTRGPPSDRDDLDAALQILKRLISNGRKPPCVVKVSSMSVKTAETVAIHQRDRSKFFIHPPTNGLVNSVQAIHRAHHAQFLSAQIPKAGAKVTPECVRHT